MSRKVLMIIAPEQFRDEELLVPRQALIDAGWTVDTASTRTGESEGMLGAVENVRYNLNFAQVEADRGFYDAAIVVGGMGAPGYLWNNAELHRLLQTIAGQNKVVAAICLSGAVLAKAGLLKGKQGTVWEMPESLAALKAGGCEYTGAPVTVDGNIITANGPDAATAFSEAVIARLKVLTPA